MSRLYDTVEPNVLKEEFLAEVVEAQKPSGEAGRLASEEGIEFHEVSELRLDFRNILRIDNLWQFRNLRKLQLDNNIIEEISGLEVLVHLEWLDLSFNNIERIEGLQSLECLQDLSLSHNRIKVIENLEGLHRLQVLSIGYNSLESVDNVLYLRQFKKLSSLNIANNPLCHSSEHVYPQYLLATLPQLVYLDFRYISPEVREEACEKYQELLDSLELKDRETERKAAEDLKQSIKLAEYKGAYVDGLDEFQLFHAMFEEDKDLEQIKLIPGVSAMLSELEKKFEVVCVDLVHEGLAMSMKRCEDRAGFIQARQEAMERNKHAALDRISVYEEYKGQLLESVKVQDQLQALLETMADEHHRLKEDLLQVEMKLVEQIDETTKDFERQYSEMVQAFQESVQAHSVQESLCILILKCLSSLAPPTMTQCRELEASHHEQVSAMANQLLEKFSRNQLEEDECPDQLRMLLVDKDSFLSLLTASHDVHFLAIDSKEDCMIQSMNKDKDTFLTELQEEEFARNRGRVLEITHYLKYEREVLEEFEDNFAPIEET